MLSIVGPTDHGRKQEAFQCVSNTQCFIAENWAALTLYVSGRSKQACVVFRIAALRDCNCRQGVVGLQTLANLQGGAGHGRFSRASRDDASAAEKKSDWMAPYPWRYSTWMPMTLSLCNTRLQARFRRCHSLPRTATPRPPSCSLDKETWKSIPVASLAAHHWHSQPRRDMSPSWSYCLEPMLLMSTQPISVVSHPLCSL